MAKTGRTASFTIVALVLGFVSGVWLVGTGVVYRFIPAPQIEPANAIAVRPKGLPSQTALPQPRGRNPSPSPSRIMEVAVQRASGRLPTALIFSRHLAASGRSCPELYALTRRGT